MKLVAFPRSRNQRDLVRKFAGFSFAAITVAALLLTVSSLLRGLPRLLAWGRSRPWGDLRRFTFNANTEGTGVTTGQTQGNNRSSGVKWHGTITCLNVVGNVAPMSGVVTDITPGLGDPFLVGNFIQFQVIDMGEGANAPPDLISLMPLFPTRYG